MFLMGQPWLRLGCEYNTGESAKSKRCSKETKTTNANANVTTGVKVTVAKGFRFGGSKVAATEAAFA